MNEIATHVDPCDPVESYVRPIRSVLFVDDQFPTFGQSPPYEAKETERARALWQVCTERGWLCDVDNSPDWTSPERKQRLAASDLLVLDLHLDGDDSRAALAIVRDLARSKAPNLVVVYTADPELDQALISVAASARGVSEAALEFDLDPEFEEMKVEWTREDLLAFFAGKKRWMETFKTACRAAGLGIDPGRGEVLLERWIAKELDASHQECPLPIEKMCFDNRWFQCGNLFLVVIGKPSEQTPEQETAVFMDGLETAVREWAPSWLACLVASSRRSVETGAFRDDVNLPKEPLQAGLLRYVRANKDHEERDRRSREIASYLLSRRFEIAAGFMSQHLLLRAEAEPGEPPSADERQAQLLQLNAFLCSEFCSRHHLRVGTIFRAEDPESYWVCVTPACDMVPRDRKRSTDPWAVELDPLRPMLALRLEIRRRKEIAKALNEAERGRYLFFWDSARQAETPIVAACFNTETGDPNPKLEQMFALDRARVHGGKVVLQRCVRNSESDGVSLARLECDVVCQLRAPYAERLAHVVGYHLSRIGVNFLQPDTEAKQEQDRPS